jgi:iron complex transport system permease protein
MTAAAETTESFSLRVIPLPVALPALAFLLVSIFILAVSMGAVKIPVSEVLSFSLSDQERAILLDIRLPRVLLAGIVGAGLAVAGCTLQGIFRNPLADPSLIGISSGAALAAAAVIVLAGPISGYFGIYALSVAAFIGGIAACWVIFLCAGFSGNLSVAIMLLAGIALTAIAEGATGFLSYLSTDQQLRTLTFWRMGSFGGALWPAVIVAATIVLPCLGLMMKEAAGLNVLLLGDSEACCLGVDSDRLKRRLVGFSALVVGGSVAVSGVIVFIGLVVPHLVRLTISPDHRLLMPASALLGAGLMIAADTAARTLAAPAEIPVGILTSLIGGPFFLWLLLRLQREGIT